MILASFMSASCECKSASYPRLSVSLPPYRVEKCNDEAGDSRIEVGWAAQDVNIDEFRLRLVAQITQDARAQFVGVLARRDTLQEADKAAIAHEAPTRLAIEFVDHQSGFFQQLATQIAGQVEPAATVDIVR